MVGHRRRIDEHIGAEPVGIGSIEVRLDGLGTIYLASRFAIFETVQLHHNDNPEPTSNLKMSLRRLRQVDCGASMPSERCTAAQGAWAEWKNVNAREAQFSCCQLKSHLKQVSFFILCDKFGATSSTRRFEHRYGRRSSSYGLTSYYLQLTGGGLPP